MNKLLVVTVVVFIIIVSIIVSASLISDKNARNSSAGSRTSYATMTDAATKQDFVGLQSKVLQNDSEFSSIVKRVNDLEQMQRALYEQITQLSNSVGLAGDSANKEKTEGLNCQITGYLNMDNTPVSREEIESGSINSDVVNGRKKMTLSCSY